MTHTHLGRARVRAGWTQQRAAERLGVSQPYYCQLEKGSRPVTPALAKHAMRRLRLSPAVLPLPALSPRLSPLSEDHLADSLARLGYPGFAAMKKRSEVNPAELVARALVHENLDTRLVEALPWVLAKFDDLDWEWLAAQCRVLNLQNRLGFLTQLAAALPNTAPLATALKELEASRLVNEGTLCRESMREAERNWVRKNRPDAAAHWNLLTTLTPNQLTHAQ